jgi:hypothetical protein
MLKFIGVIVIGFVCGNLNAADIDFSFGIRSRNHHHYYENNSCWFGPRVVIRLGHWETRYDRVLVVREYSERVWVEPIFEVRNDKRYLVRDGYYKTIWYPAQYEERKYTVWVQ